MRASRPPQVLQAPGDPGGASVEPLPAVAGGGERVLRDDARPGELAAGNGGEPGDEDRRKRQSGRSRADHVDDRVGQDVISLTDGGDDQVGLLRGGLEARQPRHDTGPRERPGPESPEDDRRPSPSARPPRRGAQRLVPAALRACPGAWRLAEQEILGDEISPGEGGQERRGPGAGSAVEILDHGWGEPGQGDEALSRPVDPAQGGGVGQGEDDVAPGDQGAGTLGPAEGVEQPSAAVVSRGAREPDDEDVALTGPLQRLAHGLAEAPSAAVLRLTARLPAIGGHGAGARGVEDPCGARGASAPRARSVREAHEGRLPRLAQRARDVENGVVLHGPGLDIGDESGAAVGNRQEREGIARAGARPSAGQRLGDRASAQPELGDGGAPGFGAHRPRGEEDPHASMAPPRRARRRASETTMRSRSPRCIDSSSP